jgi:hypothetical protein
MELENSENSLLQSIRKFNIITTVIIITVGLFGNFLIIFVYSKKKFRLNSNCIYLLFLSANDSLFLIIHFFEDTIRTINDTYSNIQIIEYFNFVDKYDLICRLTNYLRNTLRLISAYVIVAFTIQRLLIVYKPLTGKFKTKKSAFYTCSLIAASSCLLNIWTFFVFILKADEETYFYCDVNRDFTNIYFYINSIYTIFLMFLPIIIIFLSNVLIIIQTFRKENRRKRFKSLTYRNRQINDPENQQYQTKKITKTLLLVSFSYSILNLPYLIIWGLFFTEMIKNDYEMTEFKNLLFSILQIAELFNILNYGIHFFVYSISGTLFRSQLKQSININAKRHSATTKISTKISK